ncbi:MAG: ribbon-helix-helix protein, CopG family [Elusimicrobia bacterium]|nr:ribbon-helix-helix protein, CopG family [Elusimicrobiota bacterium]
MQNRQAQPITITIPPQMLAIADKIARKEGRTRSDLFREALRAYFWKKRWEAIQTYGAKKVRAKGLKEEDIEGLIDELRS